MKQHIVSSVMVAASVVLSAFVLLGCGDGDEDPTGVTLDKTTLTLSPGEADILTATVTPKNARDKVVFWTSNDTTVTTVTRDGVVQAKKAGSAAIRATTFNGITAACAVTVRDNADVPENTPVTGVTLSTRSLELPVSSANVTLTAIVIPNNATDREVYWGSSNPTVVRVLRGTYDSALGIVTVLGVGQATITATTADGGFSDTCVVTVSE